jgi:uncharacterized delta-60 repeat protein
MGHVTRSRHRLASTIVPAIVALTICGVLLYAASGSLDPSFGHSGTVTTNFSATSDSGDYAAAAGGAFGFIVAAGGSNASGSYDFAVARYTANGGLDSTFGTGGKVTTDFSGSSDDRAFAMAIDSSGNTVLAGRSNDSFALARYLLNGSLDPNFGTGGKVTTSFSSSISVANAVAIQTDGKIVAAGLSDANVALARYNSNGTLDVTFGTGGTVITDVGTAAESAQVHAIAIQSNGKIVVAGNFSPEISAGTTSLDSLVARYNTDGQLDVTFAGGGIYTEDVSGANQADSADAVALLSNGNIVAGGFTEGASNNVEMALTQLTANGTLAPAFGVNGHVFTSFGPGTFSGISTLSVQTRGNILAGGFVDVTGEDFAVARYTATGTLDASFGSGGVATTNFGTSTDDVVGGLVIQPTGKIVTVGSSDNDFALARYGR